MTTQVLSASSNKTQCVAFNTGAYYSSKGQRIAVWLRTGETGHVELCCLVDFDRQICCYFPVRMPSLICTSMDLCLHAMHMYQWCQYDFGVSATGAAAVRDEMLAVLANGYDAFIQSPEVRVLANVSACLR